jgi:hypothetical protein
MNQIQLILTELGYKLSIDKDGWRTNAVFRGGDNPTAIKVFSKDGSWIDFVESKRGKLEDLIALSLGDKTKVQDFLKGKLSFDPSSVSISPKIKIPEIFDEKIVNDLIPDFSYWQSRGIDKKVAELFKGGLCLDCQSFLAKLKNRQILVIYNGKNQIIGLTGRSLNNKLPKWKHIGAKSNWVWPASINQKIIREKKEVILVESPVDILKLWECGIQTAICLFGTEFSFAILNFLLKVNPSKIIIATNNEESCVGNDAAVKIYNRLKRYFNLDQLQIKLPPAKDFGEISDNKVILDWYSK